MVYIILFGREVSFFSFPSDGRCDYKNYKFFAFLFFFMIRHLSTDELIWLQGQETPIYIWYESYPTHSGEGYEGRVSRVSPDSPFGAASLNLTNIRESDQGWYECKVVFLNRSPNQHKNGTWFHLDVHAPPRFSVTPEDIIYVNLGEQIAGLIERIAT